MLLRSKIILLLNMIILIIMITAANAEVAKWQKLPTTIFEPEITTIATHPANHSVIYAGTEKGLYRTLNGKDFRRVLSPAGKNKSVNDISIFENDPDVLYVSTDSGLYESTDKGGKWERIYYSSDSESGRVMCAFRFHDDIYLGTTKEIFVKNVRDKSWSLIKNLNQPVYSCFANGGFFYWQTDSQIYRLDVVDNFYEKIFSGNMMSPDEETDSKYKRTEERYIKFSGVIDDQLYAGTSDGIYLKSVDADTWEKIPTDNIALKQMTSLVITSHGECGHSDNKCFEMLVASKRGAFFFNDGLWVPIYRGMETNNISDIANDMNGNVYAATDRGIFFLSEPKTLPFLKVKSQIHNFKTEEPPVKIIPEFNFDDEPRINQVHDWVINYAEVNSDKIQEWRKLVKKRSFFPSLDIGLDASKNRTISNSIYGSSSSGGSSYIGPNDKTFYDNLGFDVSLSWDMADFIWSDEQLSIDSRSKMMVELRENLLDQVTRLYFERRRLQIEIATLDQTTTDPLALVDKEMRVEELTALIDSYTGGKFSQNIKK